MNKKDFRSENQTLKGKVQMRWKSVQNWKRPTMDEYTVPTESWKVVHKRQQKKYGGLLLTGSAFLAATLAINWSDFKRRFHSIPRHLIDAPEKPKKIDQLKNFVKNLIG